MKADLVSFVVPVYNAEKYIEKCVSSILMQTHKNIEVVLVDDGSIDKSPIICDNIAKKNPKVRVFHQKNAGPGVARNTGLENISGDYLVFVDADDYIISTYVEETLRIAEKYNADIVEVGYVSMDPLKNRVVYNDLKTTVIQGRENLVKDYFSPSGKLQNTLWSRFFKLDKIRDFRFSDKSVGEDSEFCLKALSRCDIFVKYNKPLYAYRCYNDSITRSNLKARNFDAPEVVLRDITFCESIGIELDSYNDALNNFTNSVGYLLNRIAVEKQEKNFASQINKIKELYEEFEVFAQTHNAVLDKTNLDIIEDLDSWAQKFRKENRKILLKKSFNAHVKNVVSKYKNITNYEFDIEKLK